MKLITLLLSFIIICTANSFAQQRYIDKVFNEVQVTSNITYGQNISVLTGAPLLQNLIVDVYEPVGDSLTARPLIVYLHPGDFLPILINGQPTGYLQDSAVVEMCKQFARRGYVVANMDFRLGWNPISAIQDCRTATLVQAVYRVLQDAKTCVRYFRMNAAIQGNTYKIDTTKIVVGGDESSGYVSIAYASLDSVSELLIPGLISGTTSPLCGLAANQPYIDQSVMGDFDGLGGLPQFNNPNWPNYSSKINMVFSMEAGLIDSTWMEAGEVPVVALHDINNPLSPFASDTLFFPFVNAVGSHNFIRYANTLGNNDVFHINWTDPYSIRANTVNGGGPWEYEGLFPIEQPDPSLIIPGDPFHGQVSPWEWWDSTDLGAFAPLLGVDPSAAYIIYQNGLLVNPDMSKDKALRYIDTAQYYLSERICLALGLCMSVGSDEVQLFKDQVTIFPNPSAQFAHLKLADAASHFLAIKIYDVEGRKVFDKENLHQNFSDIPCDQLGKGMFIIQALTEKGIAIGKLIIE